MIAICDERLRGRHVLTVVDVYQEPARAKADQIVAVPALLKKRPLPVRRLIGDLSDRARVLQGLNLPPDAESRDERARQNESDHLVEAPQATASHGAKTRGS
ncbi:MAG: hypothetical protein M3O36_04220 [Myxococcota bacterium]|nr:hypothetical protein [Myxococcota bacterium]